MKVEIQLVNEKGLGIPAKERGARPKYRGALRIREERVHALGRTTTVAKLLSSTDDAEEPVVPYLTDASVLFVDDGQMRARGFEVAAGVQFGQVWDVRVLPC